MGNKHHVQGKIFQKIAPKIEGIPSILGLTVSTHTPKGFVEACLLLRVFREFVPFDFSSSWWTFRIFFIFFGSGEGNGEVQGDREGGGVGFLLKIPGGGGLPEGGGGGGARGPGGCLPGIWGRGG